ncbi:MAG: hypothetical protein RLY16_850 [Bacteroidota bacterium]|jgi:hypothetical protein
MKMNIQKLRGVVAMVGCCIILLGCEKNVDLNLNQVEDVLVVDAIIENDQPPVVILTTSLNYFNNINAAILNNLFIHNAVVKISNGSLTHQLREVSTPSGLGFNLYAYTLDPSNSTTAFLGELNKQYQLKIEVDGKVYEATTHIPSLDKRIDSLWWKIPTLYSGDDPNKVVVMLKATDPPGLGNYIRYFTKKNSEPFLPGQNSTFDDQIIDGTTYSLQVDPGIDRNNPIKADSNYFKKGDTVTFKLSNIDRDTYRFWNTWEFAAQSIGNPFSQPGKVLGNISNGALGAFYGYANDFKTIIIPR